MLRNCNLSLFFFICVIYCSISRALRNSHYKIKKYTVLTLFNFLKDIAENDALEWKTIYKKNNSDNITPISVLSSLSNFAGKSITIHRLAVRENCI